MNFFLNIKFFMKALLICVMIWEQLLFISLRLIKLIINISLLIFPVPVKTAEKLHSIQDMSEIQQTLNMKKHTED